MNPDLDYEPVEITKDNFYDYFEITTSGPRTYTYADGSTAIGPGFLQISMKEDVADRIKVDGSSLTVGVKAKKDLYRAKVDFENVTVTLGDKMKSDTKKELRKNASWFEPKVDIQIELFEEYHGQTYIGGILDSDFFWYKDSEYNSWSNGPAEQGSKAKYYQVVYKDIELVNVTGTLFIAK